MPKKNRPYTVKITETAWEMLISHVRFLANASVPAVNGLIDTFVEMTDSHAAMPECSPWLEHDAIPKNTASCCLASIIWLFIGYRKILSM